MQELNKKIDEVFKKVPVAQFIPKGFVRECGCNYSVPSYSLGKLVITENKKTHKREYTLLPIARYYCPICGMELSRDMS